MLCYFSGCRVLIYVSVKKEIGAMFAAIVFVLCESSFTQSIQLQAGINII